MQTQVVEFSDTDTPVKKPRAPRKKKVTVAQEVLDCPSSDLNNKIEMQTPVLDCSNVSEEQPEVLELWLEKALAWNQRKDVFFQIASVFFDGETYTMLLERRRLDFDLHDLFDDRRVDGAVMRGEKIPSVEEYWNLCRREETKMLQVYCKPLKTWFSDKTPEKKHRRIWKSH